MHNEKEEITKQNVCKIQLKGRTKKEHSNK